MKNILVFGAGLVSRPLISYFIKSGDIRVTVASQVFANKEYLDSEENVTCKDFDINDDDGMDDLVKSSDFVISLLPYRFHTKIAKSCIKHKKNMLTASYVSDEIRDLDDEAKKAGIVIMNEVGLDPGIDHMSAMKIIDDIHKNGGKVKSFISNCGGLPLWDAISTPFKYKFSWSPEGVVLAAKNPAKYLENGQIVNIENKRVFNHYKRYNLQEFGEYEVYPNRDSLNYIETYGLKSEVETMYRGTFRNLGWCNLFSSFLKIDLLRQSWEFDFETKNYREFMIELLSRSEPVKTNLNKELAHRLKVHEQSEIILKMEWLGLFSDKKITLKSGTPFELLCHLLKEKLQYGDGERDLVILLHEFEVEYPDRVEKLESLLIHRGTSGADSSMSQTVGYPAAIVAKLILEGKFKRHGVHIPIYPEIYEEALSELKKLGISFLERKEIKSDWYEIN